MSRVPKYRQHPNGQAFVCHKSIQRPGHRLYLGKHGSPESERAYKAFIKQLFNRQPDDAPITSLADLSVAELAQRYLIHAESYYQHNGQPTSEMPIIAQALKLLARHLGNETAAEIGPKRLLEYQKRLISLGLARTTINAYVIRVKRCFRWGAQEELIPPSTWHGLDAVNGLRKGRSKAREAADVGPVPQDVVIATLPHMPPAVAAMARVQYMIGARPQDVCRMRPMDLDRSRDVWIYLPESHKTSWRDATLVKAIPPKAQAVLGPLLGVASHEYVFRPAARKRGVGDRYTTASYRRAIHRACDAAFPPPESLRRSTKETAAQWMARLGESGRAELARWQSTHRWSPHQLRHGISSKIAATLGEGAAQKWLGHASLDATAGYIHREIEELIRIARQVAQLPEAEL